LIDENTPKEIAAFNFLLTDTEPLVPVLKIELLNEGNENKILLSPLKEITFTISPRSGISDGSKQVLLSTPKKIRVVDQMQTDKQKYMLHLKDLSINQRVLTID